MQIYCIKIRTLLDDSARLLIIDNDKTTCKDGANLTFINNVIQGLQRRYRCDVYIEDFNHLGEAEFISDLREDNCDDGN